MRGPLHYRPPRRHFRRDFLTYFAGAAAIAASSACAPPARKDNRVITPQGERVECGALVFNVLESVWLPQLGQLPMVRMPKHRFLKLRLSVTNQGGAIAGCPMQSLLDTNGNAETELTDVTGLEEWLGVVRMLPPGGTEIGWIVFDVPQKSYILRLSDGQIENEHVGYVNIPYSIE